MREYRGSGNEIYLLWGQGAACKVTASLLLRTYAETPRWSDPFAKASTRGAFLVGVIPAWVSE